MAQPDYGYNPSAGWVPPPGNSVDPNYSPYGNIYNNNTQRPKHHSYDANGQPIPPGFEPPPSTGSQQNYPPPPREDQYGADPYGRPPPGRSEYDRGYYDAPPSDYGYPGSGRGYGDRDRPYAPDEPYPHDGNAITPFDEEKYEAEVRDEQARRYAAQQGPPPSDYFDRDRRRGHPDDRRHDPRDRYDDRYSDDSYYDPRDRDPRDRRYEDERDRDRRHDDRLMRQNSRQKDEPRSPTKKSKDIFDGREAQVLGGAAGGFIGNQFGGGVLETLGGVVVGAVGAKVLEKQKMKRDGKKLSGEPPTRREKEGVRRELAREERRSEPRGDPRDDLRRDPRDDRRGDPRDYAGGRSRSRGAGPREDYYYSDEYSPSPPPGPRR